MYIWLFRDALSDTSTVDLRETRHPLNALFAKSGASDRPQLQRHPMAILHRGTVLRERTSHCTMRIPSKRMRLQKRIASKGQLEISASNCRDNTSRASDGTTCIGWIPGVRWPTMLEPGVLAEIVRNCSVCRTGSRVLVALGWMKRMLSGSLS